MFVMFNAKQDGKHNNHETFDLFDNKHVIFGKHTFLVNLLIMASLID